LLQSSALAQQEQEQQEAEKRLKAALTAKREPNATNSRVASPAPGKSTSDITETKISTESTSPMDVDPAGSANVQEDVCTVLIWKRKKI